MKRNRGLLPCLLATLVLSCTNPGQEADRPEPQVRTALKSTGTGAVKVSVVVEGSDGNALNGAVVGIQDERNTITPLNYDTATFAYTGTIEEYDGASNYTVTVSSAVLGKPRKITVPYTTLSAVPRVNVFQDADGNSVLGGQTLLSARPIQIGWNVCGEDVVYQIAIKTALKKIYAATTTAATVTVPADAVPAGAYMLEITAQKIHGDMYFVTAPYYSVSAATGPLVTCNVQ